MSIEKFLLAGAMSLLSILFGCKHKAIAINGPDHEGGKNAVIHIKQTARVEYILPGNMSKQFGFESIREQEEKTKNIDLITLKSDDFEWQKWRYTKFIDAGRWDYMGPKNKGLPQN